MSYNLSCDWKSGFVMDPAKKQRVGYLTAFEGLDLGDGQLAQDVEVFCPWNPDATNYGSVTMEGDDKKVKCVGVIEQFTFGGGVGDPIGISAYMSAENANLIAAKQKIALSTTKITKLGFWICNFDTENKKWFEEAYPKDPEAVQGQLNANGDDVRLTVATTATMIAPTLDLSVYNIHFEIVPAANSTFALHFAQDASKQFVRNWGLKVGTQAESAFQ